MKKLLSLIVLVCVVKALHAQQPYVYTIFADSVKITNDCDTAELILENHTQNVPGFLFNKGRGRTEFRRVLNKITDTLYTVGPDSIKLPYAWVQGGNSFGTTGIFGTKDNNHIDFYTNNAQRGRWTNTGNLLLGTTTDDGYKLNVNGNILAGSNSLIGTPDLASITNTTALKVYGNLDVTTAQQYGANGGFKVRYNLWGRPGATSMILNDVEMTAYDGRIFFGGGNAPYFGVRIWGDNVEGGPFSRTKYTLGNDAAPKGNNDSWATFGSSNQNEFQTSSDYPSGVNWYYLETHLTSPVVSSNTGQVGMRAPLKIGARQLWFYTGNNDLADAEAMRVTENRNLLIGSTTDNGNKLQVNGTTFSNYFTNSPTPLGTIDDGALRLRWGGTGTSHSDGSYIDYYYQGSNVRRGFIASASDSRPLRIEDQIGVTFWNTPFVAIGSEWSNNGNTAKLSIQNGFNSTLDALNIARLELPNTFHYDLIVKPTGNVVMGGDVDNGNKLQVTGNSYFNGAQQVTGAVRFSGLTNSDTLSRIMVIDANGNVYYRYASSLAANDLFKSDLAVAGTISAPKMTITQPGAWPDYVFKPQYKLPSLTDVEQFIQKNSHLPGVPSAAEVEKKGIDVGENQAALLKKIEELTLYLIQQQKEQQEMKKEIAELKTLLKNK